MLYLSKIHQTLRSVHLTACVLYLNLRNKYIVLGGEKKKRAGKKGAPLPPPNFLLREVETE